MDLFNLPAVILCSLAINKCLPATLIASICFYATHA
jgi:hypothetical protein